MAPLDAVDAGRAAPSAAAAAAGRGRWLAGLSLSRRIVGVSLILLAMLHIGNGVLLAHFYRATAMRQQEARDARATLLAEHASRTIGAVDLSLETIVDRAGPALAGPPSVFNQMLLDDHVARLPQVRALVVLDASGIRVLDSREYPARPLDLSDRPYFTEQQRWRGVGLYIDRLQIGRADHKPFVGMSRPILDSNGGFRGVIMAMLDPSYFSSFYGGNEYDERVALARDDGGLLVSGASEQLATSSVGATIAGFLGSRTSQIVVRRPVPSLPLQVVLAGPPASASTAFRGFVLADCAVLAMVSLLALWLTHVLARHAAARELAELRLREAIEGAPAGFALFDGDDRLVLGNDLYRSMFGRVGYPVVPGARFEDLVRAAFGADGKGELTPEVQERIAARLRLHRAGDAELLQHMPDGRWIFIRERCTKDGGVLCFTTDITAMKQQEEALRRSEQAERMARERAEEANRAKSSFLATMSHELRTPLNAVIGFSEVMERELLGPLSGRYREYGALIRKSGEHLLGIINDILDIAKLQSGKTELHLEPVAVAALVEDAVSLVEGPAAAAAVNLTVAVPDDLGIVADRQRMRQVLLNLVSNAIKFTPRGGAIRIAAQRAQDGARIEVADTGIGMASEDIPRALEPFGQVANAMVRDRHGTGLGLPLSKSLVEHHGARLEIASAPGVGTTVTIVFPPPLVIAVARAADARLRLAPARRASG